ncbi:hypothetical protein GALL_349160 [mine drainage metagenome]|uniref:Uncharacterized protein n=1 Tax=mine drainage metagenome TaxID=410659 RepID=A0A1J5R0N2_9ZZZZ
MSQYSIGANRHATHKRFSGISLHYPKPSIVEIDDDLFGASTNIFKRFPVIRFQSCLNLTQLVTGFLASIRREYLIVIDIL